MALLNATDVNLEKKWRGIRNFLSQRDLQVIVPNTGIIEDIKNEVRLSSPHISYRLIV